MGQDAESLKIDPPGSSEEAEKAKGIIKHQRDGYSSFIEKGKIYIKEGKEKLDSAEIKFVAADKIVSKLCETYENEIERLKRVISGKDSEINFLQSQNAAQQKRSSEANSNMQTLQARISQLEDKADGFSNENKLIMDLKRSVESFPPALRKFVESLIDVCGHATKKDMDWLTNDEGLKKLDDYVYRSPPNWGMMKMEREGDSVCAEDILRVVALQNKLHHTLQALGIRILCPMDCDPFNPMEHTRYNESDIVLCNDDEKKDNCVAGPTKRIGYIYGDKVVRQAEVKLYRYQGKDAGPVSTGTATPSSSRSETPEKTTET